MKLIPITLIFSLINSLCYGQIITYELVQSWDVRDSEHLLRKSRTRLCW